jgi:PIN domain nuclease of toxin-antitoxin system
VDARERNEVLVSAITPRETHSDPADRILIATARHMSATLVTAGELLPGYANGGHLKCLRAD